MSRLSKREKIRKEMEARDKEQLSLEIRDAHIAWLSAQQHFEYAQGKDQIDYAIYLLGAAEKRYEMLLRQAKANTAASSLVRDGEVG
ncbi:DUF2508 family protein [Paenibacillaceae bacterium]|nr:DUF2508 family protein [Paenibacillaceae bacterium]